MAAKKEAATCVASPSHHYASLSAPSKCVSGVPLCVAPFVRPCTTATATANTRQQHYCNSSNIGRDSDTRSCLGPYRNIQQMFSMFHCEKFSLFPNCLLVFPYLAVPLFGWLLSFHFGFLFLGFLPILHCCTWFSIACIRFILEKVHS